jgi:hypothetical protein
MNYINTYSHVLLIGVSGGILYNIALGTPSTSRNITELKVKELINYGFLGGGILGFLYGYFNKPLLDVLMEIKE